MTDFFVRFYRGILWKPRFIRASEPPCWLLQFAISRVDQHWSRHFTKTTSFDMAVKTDYAMCLFTYFSNINRLFASIVKKNRLPLNNRFGGQLKFFGGNQGKYISFVWFDNWLFASHFSTASDVTYGAKTAHMCARSLSKVLRELPVVRRESNQKHEQGANVLFSRSW